MTHCLLLENLAGSLGGGLYSTWTTAAVTHCTMSGNAATGEGSYDLPNGGGLFSYRSELAFMNSILWRDEPNEVYVDPEAVGDPVFTHCDVQGGYPGVGNIDADPGFRSYADFDCVLWPGSPCIDAAAGEDDAIPWSRVHPAYGRHNLPVADMGAYGGPGNLGWIR